MELEVPQLVRQYAFNFTLFGEQVSAIDVIYRSVEIEITRSKSEEINKVDNCLKVIRSYSY